MGCTGSKSEIFSLFRHENRKRIRIGSWIRRRIRKVGENQTSRTSSRIQNVSEILRKSSPVPAKSNSPRRSSKVEIAMADAIEKNQSEEISVVESLNVSCRAENDDDTSFEVMEEKIKLWQMAACLKVNSSRPQAAKGPRKPTVFTSNNRTDGLSAEFRKLEQDMEDVIDGKDQGKSLSDTSADKRVENGAHSAGRVVSVNDFCISQISNDRRVRPKAAHGFRTPNTVVSAVEYVLPGAVLDLSDVEARSHLSVNGSKAKQDQCLLAWMERQASKDAQQ